MRTSVLREVHRHLAGKNERDQGGCHNFIEMPSFTDIKLVL